VAFGFAVDVAILTTEEARDAWMRAMGRRESFAATVAGRRAKDKEDSREVTGEPRAIFRRGQTATTYFRKSEDFVRR